MSDDWTLLQDFDSTERDHSQPRWEYQIIDDGDTVALRETPAMTRDPKLHYIPADVVEAIDTGEP